MTTGAARSQEKSAASQSTERVGSGQISRAELQAAVMSFADTYKVTIVQAVTIMADQLDTPEARVTASRMQVYSTASAVDIATGPYPGVNLLDMVVSIDRLLSSAGWERTMPRLIQVVEKLEADTNKWMLRSFLMGAGLILIFFATLLAYRHATKKL